MTQLGRIELDTTLANYAWVGEWIDAGDAETIRVAYGFEGLGMTGPNVFVEQSNDQMHIIGPTVGITEGSSFGQKDVDIAAQYFRLRAVTYGGDPAPTLRAVIRVMA